PCRRQRDATVRPAQSASASDRRLRPSGSNDDHAATRKEQETSAMPLTKLVARTALLVTLSLLSPQAFAADQPQPQDSAEPGFLTGIWTRSTLLGDAGGLRT